MTDVKKKVKRDWNKYNESLVKRGELLLGLDFLDKWDKELEEMNRQKEGAPFEYPNNYIDFLRTIKYCFHLPSRQLEGFAKGLSKLISGIKAPDYTQICRRINTSPVDFNSTIEESDEEVVIACDASGIKITNRGEWLKHRHKDSKRKGFIKIHIAVDVKKKKILAMEVTDEKVGDNTMLPNLIESTLQKRPINSMLGDGSFDTNEIFDMLEDIGAEAIIPVRQSSSPIYIGPLKPVREVTPRERAVLEQQRDFEGWKKKHKYGDRWMAENRFSIFKGTFGEHAQARKFENVVLEMLFKAALLNRFCDLS